MNNKKFGKGLIVVGVVTLVASLGFALDSGWFSKWLKSEAIVSVTVADASQLKGLTRGKNRFDIRIENKSKFPVRLVGSNAC